MSQTYTLLMWLAEIYYEARDLLRQHPVVLQCLISRIQCAEMRRLINVSDTSTS
jgi:hypothetical protein